MPADIDLEMVTTLNGPLGHETMFDSCVVGLGYLFGGEPSLLYDAGAIFSKMAAAGFSDEVADTVFNAAVKRGEKCAPVVLGALGKAYSR
jgi:hypothetical protein